MREGEPEKLASDCVKACLKRSTQPVQIRLSLCRSIICGLTQFTNKSHLAFAALEAVCFQTREVSGVPSKTCLTAAISYDLYLIRSLFFLTQILDAMNQDSGIPLTQLQVDGGMTSNRLLMQLQADILCIPVGEIPIGSRSDAVGKEICWWS